jgi:chromosome segregation ATPase
MMLTPQEKSELTRLYLSLSGDLGEAMEKIAIRAVELVAARGGTMTAEEIVDACKSPCRPSDTRRLRQHITAQGATVAILQAKVEALEGRLEESMSPPSALAELIMVKAERDTLRADVERLKAAQRSWEEAATRWEKRAETAESRLAVWEKERAEDALRMGEAARAITELSSEAAQLRVALAQAQALNRGLLS